MLCIRRATLLTPDTQIDDGVLLIERGRILAVGDATRIAVPDDAAVIDAGGLIVAPGFIDLQLNGAFGDDFTLRARHDLACGGGAATLGRDQLPAHDHHVAALAGSAGAGDAGGRRRRRAGRAASRWGCTAKGRFSTRKRRAPTIPHICGCPRRRRGRVVAGKSCAAGDAGAGTAGRAGGRRRTGGRAASLSAPATRWRPIVKPKPALPPASATARTSSTPCRRSNIASQDCPARC
jgi:hypothetical protein